MNYLYVNRFLPIPLRPLRLIPNADKKPTAEDAEDAEGNNQIHN